MFYYLNSFYHSLQQYRQHLLYYNLPPLCVALYAFSGKPIFDWRKKKYTNFPVLLIVSVFNTLAGKRKARLFKLEKVISCLVYNS